MRRLWNTTAVFVLALCVVLGATPFRYAAAAGDTGYVSIQFGNSPGNGDPTADKPQSKLWFNDGAWWALMFAKTTNQWHIYRLNWPDTWVDTGVQVDDRATSRGDALWDGAKLYVASLVRNSSSNQGRLYRYSYTTATDTYSLDAGFPVQIMTGRAETMAFDKDSTGQLWITFTQSSKVYVNSSQGNDASWGTPFVVPGASNLDSDDISSLVSYQNNIGVLWSNQRDDKMYFSYHRDADADTTWQPIVAIYSGTNAADDHINLKSLQSDNSGRLFAAVKTSLSGSNDPFLHLLWRDTNGTWGSTVFGRVSDNHTRPLVLLDSTNNKVYMFATSPQSCGAIYMKSTSISAPDFSGQPGLGDPFIKSSTYSCLNNVTSTKQTLSAATGMVAMAGDESKKYYMFNAVSLGTPPPDTTAPTVVSRAPEAGAVNVDVTSDVTATFDENVTGVNTTSFMLTPAAGPPVAASVSYNAATRTATLNPTANLTPGVIYTASLTSAITDAAGNPLAATSWSFTTTPPPDTTPPTVTAFTPANGAVGVGVAASATATFSEPMNGATINGSSVTLQQGANNVPATVSYDVVAQKVTLKPAADLAFNTTYTVNLSANITDLAGNALAPVSWSFTTAAAPDSTPPTVVAQMPANDAVGVAVNANVTATFSEAMDSTSISDTTFTLTGPNGAVAATVTYNAATKTATLNPAAALEPGATYTVVLVDARDLAGNSLAAPVSWSFTIQTAPAPELPLYMPLIWEKV